MITVINQWTQRCEYRENVFLMQYEPVTLVTHWCCLSTIKMNTMSKNDMARMSVSIMDKDKKTGGLEVLHEMFFLKLT